MNLESLISEDGAFLNREAFSSREIYELEQERIFRRCWLFLGHTSQLQKRRDFFTTYMGEESVIVTKDNAGELHVLLNTCRHRGMAVCRADKGSTAAFTCPYHAWTYDISGALTGVPKLQEAYYGQLDRSELGLVSVAQVDTYKGLIFATFDPDAPSLTDYLGDITLYLDSMIDRGPAGTEVITGIHKWLIPSNWKLPVDNLAGDAYHLIYAHGSIFRGNARAETAINQISFSPIEGHAMAGSLMPEPLGHPGNFSDPRFHQYYAETMDETVERLGPVGSRLRIGSGIVFPTFSIIPSAHSIRVFHPRGPDLVECWSYCLVPKDMPAEMREMAKRDYIQRFGPSGTFEQDDCENFTRINAAVSGPTARSVPSNYQMGVGHDNYHEELPGLVSARGPADTAQRSFYLRWAHELQRTTARA